MSRTLERSNFNVYGNRLGFPMTGNEAFAEYSKAVDQLVREFARFASIESACDWK
jgi:hypothetical protein